MRSLLLTLLVLAAASVCITAFAFLYGGVMIGVPYQDATPAQNAEQQHRMGVFDWLMVGAGLAWLVTFGVVVGLGVRWVVWRTRTRAGEPK